LAVTNHFDTTLFFGKKLKLAFFIIFQKNYLFDKLEFEQEQRTINGTLLRLFV